MGSTFHRSVGHLAQQEAASVFSIIPDLWAVAEDAFQQPWDNLDTHLLSVLSDSQGDEQSNDQPESQNDPHGSQMATCCMVSGPASSTFRGGESFTQQINL